MWAKLETRIVDNVCKHILHLLIFVIHQNAIPFTPFLCVLPIKSKHFHHEIKAFLYCKFSHM